MSLIYHDYQTQLDANRRLSRLWAGILFTDLFGKLWTFYGPNSFIDPSLFSTPSYYDWCLCPSSSCFTHCTSWGFLVSSHQLTCDLLPSLHLFHLSLFSARDFVSTSDLTSHPNLAWWVTECCKGNVPCWLWFPPSTPESNLILKTSKEQIEGSLNLRPAWADLPNFSYNWTFSPCYFIAVLVLPCDWYLFYICQVLILRGVIRIMILIPLPHTAVGNCLDLQNVGNKYWKEIIT